MKRRKTLFLIPAVVVALAVTACSPPDDDTATPPAAGLCERPASSTLPAAFQKTWDDLATKAKGEGSLVIVSGVSQSQGEKKIWDCFGKEFGIKITASAGSSDEINTRILAERAQKQYTVDIAMLGGAGTKQFLTTHTFAELKSQLIHPDITDRSQWYLDQIPWYADDVDQKYVTYYMGIVSPNILTMYYNTANVSQADIDAISSWQDLLNPKYKGKIVLGDVAAGEDDTEQAKGWLGLGQDYYDKLVRTMSPAVVPFGGARQITDGLARGTWDFALFIGTASGDLDQAKKDGLPVSAFTKTLKEGAWSDLSGQIGILDQAPHPATAQLFVNWLLSKEGQTAYNALVDPGVRTDSLSLRKDVPQGAITAADWARLKDPNFKLIYDPQKFAQAKKDSTAYFKQVFAELGIKP